MLVYLGKLFRPFSSQTAPNVQMLQLIQYYQIFLFKTLNKLFFVVFLFVFFCLATETTEVPQINALVLSNTASLSHYIRHYNL